MKPIIAALLAVAAIAASAGTAQAAEPEPITCDSAGDAGLPYVTGVNCRTVLVDGYPREYIVYVPSTPPVTGSARPVVFMFHGSSGNGGQFLRVSGWREQADASGHVAIFPTALRYRMPDTGRFVTKWNEYGLQADFSVEPPDYPDDAPWPADDVGFMDAVLGDVQGGLEIDPLRIYASGFSNGAGFAARLAADRSTVIAAAAFSAESLPFAVPTERRVPTWMTVGTLDDRILPQVGLPELPLDPFELLELPVVDSAVAAHVDTAGLDPGIYETNTRPNATSIGWPTTGDPVFRFTVLAGLGHAYPHVRNNDARFEAAREYWEFFLANPLP
jgi:polyhydroxybutyrate depolymerase